MTIKKLTFCILCFANAANLAEEEDFNNESSSKAVVEDNVFINKNSWNTRKWGSIYFLFPQVSGFNILGSEFSILKKLKKPFARFLNFVLSGVVEYKYMFNKSFGINARLNLNNTEIFFTEKTLDYFTVFSFEPSFEWIWRRKGKKIFSGSFSPLGICFLQCGEDGGTFSRLRNMWTLGLVLLKYEYDRRFYLNFGKIKTTWSNIFDCSAERICVINGLIGNVLSIEIGLNIVGVNDGRKKRVVLE